jgi:hypothetical protein
MVREALLVFQLEEEDIEEGEGEEEDEAVEVDFNLESNAMTLRFQSIF